MAKTSDDRRVQVIPRFQGVAPALESAYWVIVLPAPIFRLINGLAMASDNQGFHISWL